MSYALFATPLSSQQQLAPRSPRPPTISLRDAARPGLAEVGLTAEAAPHGKKPSNSEVLRRAPDAPETLLPHSAWSKGGELPRPRAAGGEGARPLPNSMPFCHSLPYRLLNQDRHALPRAASPVGRLAIRRDERLSDGRGGLPSRRRAFAGRAYPGYANPGLTADYPYRLA